jgi:DNA repair protein RecO (recombination protein O)
MRWLDAMQPVNPDFHLVFMVHLSRYLGFFRTETGRASAVLRLDGRFVLQYGYACSRNEYSTVHGSGSREVAGRVVDYGFTTAGKNQYTEGSQTPAHRELLEYYSLHVAGFGNVKSQAVLEAVWG